MKTRTGNGFANHIAELNKNKPQGLRVFKRKQREKPLTEAQAERLQQILAVYEAKATKPAAAKQQTRQLIAPQPATVWRSSVDGRIVR